MHKQDNFIDACKSDEQEFLINFKYNLKMLRTSLGYSSEELTAQMGFSGKRIIDLEEGRVPPKFEDIVRIVSFFDALTSIDQLFKSKVQLQFK